MLDFLKRILIVALMAICVGLILIGGRAEAAENSINKETNEWTFPAKGEISDVFDSRGGIHKGLDIAGKYKSGVYAVADGKVVRSYYSGSYGNVIFIHHDNGYETVYVHLNKRIVNEGQKVKKGDKIGLMGNTGQSTGIHLHFEVHKGKWKIHKENAIDPFLVFGKGEIGQYVFALNHDPYGVVNVSGKLTVSETKTNNAARAFIGKNIEKPKQVSKSRQEKYEVGNKLKNEKVYVVKSGDTLSKISRFYHVSIQQLKSWNELENIDLIHPKQKIIIKANK
ncbi:M23 family metallopeptidase [Heyndrickxia sporothermodurans]|uniref:M23 family metallopeptidase n=1 Tax=Heyndrickxia sporothermodurans TaxID=46224 RepID=UPI00192BBC14|nr:M23 family metallopeptidase [Heyndrickxia sporothermodurans]MBL5888916.1 peptidoglycan DD-metalloendopeptidase family protein [Heyndrickxia sporothermodurans]MBL5896117.1 peptidoglycan DD-metalloendopeptidase family protein [Heyndrickxia sporothermodurans]